MMTAADKNKITFKDVAGVDEEKEELEEIVEFLKNPRKFTDMGAAGAQIATRFIATYECDASPEFKKHYINVKPEDIVLIQSTVGMPGRALRSPFIERRERGEVDHISRCVVCLRPCDPRVVDYCITKALTEAAKGNWEEGLFFCGSNGYRMDKIVHVKEVIDEIMSEYQSNG